MKKYLHGKRQIKAHASAIDGRWQNRMRKYTRAYLAFFRASRSVIAPMIKTAISINRLCDVYLALDTERKTTSNGAQ